MHGARKFDSISCIFSERNSMFGNTSKKTLKLLQKKYDKICHKNFDYVDMFTWYGNVYDDGHSIHKKITN